MKSFSHARRCLWNIYPLGFSSLGKNGTKHYSVEGDHVDCLLHGHNLLACSYVYHGTDQLETTVYIHVYIVSCCFPLCLVESRAQRVMLASTDWRKMPSKKVCPSVSIIFLVKLESKLTYTVHHRYEITDQLICAETFAQSTSMAVLTRSKGSFR